MKVHGCWRDDGEVNLQSLLAAVNKELLSAYCGLTLGHDQSLVWSRNFFFTSLSGLKKIYRAKNRLQKHVSSLLLLIIPGLCHSISSGPAAFESQCVRLHIYHMDDIRLQVGLDTDFKYILKITCTATFFNSGNDSRKVGFHAGGEDKEISFILWFLCTGQQTETNGQWPQTHRVKMWIWIIQWRDYCWLYMKVCWTFTGAVKHLLTPAATRQRCHRGVAGNMPSTGHYTVQ